MQNRFLPQGHGTLEEAARGLPDHQLRRHLAVVSGDFALFEHAFDAFENNAHCVRSHSLHGLAHGSERWGAESRGGDIIEADHRAVLRHAQAGLGQGTNGAEGGHVVEG